MTARSDSPQTDHDIARADASLRRKRRDNGRTFPSLDAALTWYFEMRLKMQAPHSMAPRGTKVGSEVVIVEVDGGGGGDLDEALVTLQTIARSLEDLRAADPRAYLVLELAELGDPNVPDIDSTAMRRVEQLVDDHRRVAQQAGRKFNDEKAAAAALEAVAKDRGCPVEQMRGWWKRHQEQRPTAMTMRQISERTGEGLGTVSALHGKATYFLEGWLRHAGVLR